MSTFAERLRELRGTESQASFADAIELNRVQYAKYESGKNSPSVDVLERICRVHACSADWLLGIERRSASVTVNGSGNVVAAGTGAKAAKTVTSAVQAACKACPYKKALAKLQKAGLQIPGL